MACSGPICEPCYAVRVIARSNETCYVCHQRMRSQIAVGILSALVIAVCGSPLARGQDSTGPALPQQLPTSPQKPLPLSPIPEQTQLSPVAPCLQPPPVVSWQDYQGPLQKVVGTFGRWLERKSVGTPHYKPGAVLCSLTLGGKFLLFVEDTSDPVTFLGVGFNAGIDQAQNNQPAFGQGAAGYGMRFAYNFTGEASGEFFSVVVYSTIFKEDPRYYRLGYGSTQRRFFHALAHTVVAKREDGGNEFNFSKWLGTTSSTALLHAYHTGGETGVGPAAEGIVISIAQDAGFDVLREFWPEVAHRFKLPFRDQNQARPSGSVPR